MSKFSSNPSPVISINPSFDREPFIFGYPKKLPYSPNEKCSFCGKDSPTKRCSRCKEWYCSQICQINHWPSHKYFCVEPPPLENADGTLYIPPSLKPLRKSPTKVHFEAQNGTAERPQLKGNWMIFISFNYLDCFSLAKPSLRRGLLFFSPRPKCIFANAKLYQKKKIMLHIIRYSLV